MHSESEPIASIAELREALLRERAVRSLAGRTEWRELQDGDYRVLRAAAVDMARMRMLLSGPVFLRWDIYFLTGESLEGKVVSIGYGKFIEGVLNGEITDV